MRDGDEWVVTREKVWTTLAHHVKWCMLVARTDPGARKHQGLTHFLINVEQPEVQVRPLRHAAWAAGQEPESLPLAAATAAASAADTATRVAKAALQLHGGIGFTWEHDLQLFFKRATANAHLLGSAGEHRDRIAALVVS